MWESQARITRCFLIFCSPQPTKEDVATPLPSEKTPTSINQTPVETNEFPQLPEGLEKKPIVLKFSAMIDGIAIGAALLPSLKAEYKMGRMRSHGMTGNSSLTFQKCYGFSFGLEKRIQEDWIFLLSHFDRFDSVAVGFFNLYFNKVGP